MVNVLLAGAAAGFVATAVLAVLLMPVMKGQPGPMAVLAGKLTRKPPEQNRGLGALLHFVYGTFWGAVLAWGLDAWAGFAALTAATIAGAALALGIALWIASGMFWMPVLGMDVQMAQMPAAQRRKMSGVMLVLHLVYGAVLAGGLLAIPVEPSGVVLGNTVPAAGVALLVLVVIAGALTHRKHVKQIPGRPA